MSGKASQPLPLGTVTPYGKIEAIGFKDGERYYMCLKACVTSLIPGPVLESEMALCRKIDEEIAAKWNGDSDAQE